MSATTASATPRSDAPQASPAGSLRARTSQLWRSSRAQLAQAWAWPLVPQGFIAMLLIAAGSISPAFLPADAPLLAALPWFNSALARLLSTAVVLVGLVTLFEAWLRLRPRAGRRTAPTATWAIWSAPLLFAPPIFSRDAYSYAAQGLVVSRGMDPYQTGPIAVPGPFADQVDPLWLFTPAPYGPLALQLQRIVVELSGGHALVAAIAMRVPALVAMGVIAWALPRLATRMGVSRDHAVWLGVISPLTLLHLVGGAHNDAVMIALVVAGLLLASDGRWVVASVAVAAGAGFKQTAVLALVGVAGLAYRHAAGGPGEGPLRSAVDQRAYLRIASKVGLLAFLAFTALTVVTGLGWGWIANLSVPGSVLSFLSPVTMAGAALSWALGALGVPQEWAAMALPAVQGCGAVAAVLALGWITWVLGPRRPVAASAAAFMAFTLGGPTVYPWYVLWGAVLLGATLTDRRIVQCLVWATGWMLAYAALDVAVVNGLWILALAGIGWGVLRIGRARLDRVDEPLMGGSANDRQWSPAANTGNAPTGSDSRN
ncbi:polyprenol phosphomannose-dependent alpha 1,6 mannosyltransferase MptB [Gephyromycinifex aptenodytis]|uniref:polyprenol phosphomannose-dependent alpha 1,6 mannosyltransferase MptB n=1 Tax=Gephyromycinifex aptenodytis TaxID=2716227 RepID=UPI0014468FEA|nr:polyprenol phosphomannose-dependent alpha 1,6 mannosyltransferase MptB [Gephyromycinifex aptenodytis]